MSKDAFFSTTVRKVEVGEKVFHVRPLTGTQLESVLSLDGNESLDGLRASSLVCCFCACDAQGARLFSNDDLQRIRDEVDFTIISAVAKAAMEASGLGDDEPGKD